MIINDLRIYLCLLVGKHNSAIFASFWLESSTFSIVLGPETDFCTFRRQERASNRVRAIALSETRQTAHEP
jgi:hypothetical protein